MQLIDLPPITADHYEPFVTDITRSADAAVLFLDLANDDGPAETQAVIDRLKHARRVLVPTNAAERRPDDVLPADAAGGDEVRRRGGRHPPGDGPRRSSATASRLSSCRAERGDGLDELRKAIFDAARRDADLHEAAGQAGGHDRAVHRARSAARSPSSPGAFTTISRRS